MSYRATEIQQALDWIQMARDLAGNAPNGSSITYRLDMAVARLRSALDIKPSEAAIAEVVAAQQVAA